MAVEQRNVIDILTHDHREVERMFTELETLIGVDSDEARSRSKDLTEQVTIELVRHTVAEEADVYPEVKKKVSDTEAERAKHEHAEAEETMKRLESLRPGDPKFDAELMTLMREIRTHVVEEEQEMFPHMRSIFTEEELVDLGRKVETTKKIAPTRPHPGAPDEPPGDKLLGPAVGLFDRMRDAISHRGTQR
ncbi:hemerythrin domain-containing protein [Nocardia donostiensis]|uniref:Hemerythrin-like domain-containing protein n=1 Tax=Nocardia donostiensis TaxID=1538463 RepID=A0A1V2TKH6_9NOCA|nr:hemerythrin domain-containing protein [Nocardia donostiensis]ONM50014.1 hypothetical protein B0T46_02590 [Nocardia donostiensis]OQS15673.1 hypothetical protein B0T36_06670 [Nocardia donostiensis]OQS19379.1 hypothetical protein B0T44_14325 [Nocardia donostiensis]